jgi:hypothetical protein
MAQHGVRVALARASQVNLHNALEWACGLGMADCREIQEGGWGCFKPHQPSGMEVG